MPTSVRRRLDLILATTAFLLIAAAYCVFFLPRDTVYRLGREDGLFEDLTAVCFFGTSLLFAVAYWRSRGAGNDFLVFRTKRNVFFLLLALLFFFGGGEEISWGQRIFGWETPETFQKANLQRETNLHNLVILHRQDKTGAGKSGLSEFLSAERLFSLFWLGFCIAVPVMYRFVPPFARLMRRIAMPLVPLAIGALFLVNYGMGEVLKPHALRIDLDWPLMETKECLFSVLFLFIAVYFTIARFARASTATADTELVAPAPATAPMLATPRAMAADDDDHLATA